MAARDELVVAIAERYGGGLRWEKSRILDEFAALIGHKLGHVVSGDMRRMLFMRTFQNATVWFAMAQGLKQFARWVICWAAELYILAASRHREYYADAIGAAGERPSLAFQ